MAESKYSVILAAKDQFTQSFRDFAGASDRLREDIRGQQADLRDLNRQAKDLDGYQRLNGQIEETSASLQEARTEQARLKREMNAAEQPTRKMQAAYDRATASVADLTAKHRSQRNELGRLENSFEEAGIDVGRFVEEQRRIESATEQANSALSAQRGRLAAISDAQGRVDANTARRAELRGQMVETAALGYLAAQPINQAMNVETAGAEYAKVANGATDEDIRAMTSANLRMSTERQFAAAGLGAEDLFRIQTAAAQGGIAGGEIMPFTRTAATMSAAFDMSADDAGQTLMAWRAGMGLDQERSSLLADATNELGNTFNAQSGDIADVLRRQGAVAMSAGFSEMQTAALSAALLNGGASKEVSATALKNLTGALTKGDAASKPQQEALQSLGFDPQGLASAMQSDATGTTLEVIEALQQAPPDKTSALVSQIFGEESKGAIMPLLANTEALRQAFRMVADESGLVGSMAREAAGLADTSRTTWNRSVSSFSRLATIVGTSLLPATNAVLDPLADGANLLADFAEENQTLTGVVGGTLAGLVALKAGFLGVKFAGLLVGQLFNRGNLARTQLNANMARTASSANGAVARLNATIGRLGMGGAAGGRRGRSGGRGGSFGGYAGGTAAASSAGTGAGGWRGRLAGISNRVANSRVARWGGRAAVPLMLGMGAVQAANAAGEGDAEGVGSALGGTAGGMGGAWAGAAGGAALGTMVLPGIGTAVGGAVGGIAGGIAGSSAGEWVGEKAGSLWNWAFGDDDEADDRADRMERVLDRVDNPPDQLDSPEAASATVNTTNQTDARTISPRFDIKIEASGDSARDEILLDRLMQRLRSEILPLMESGGLDVRLDAGLTDRGS